MKKYKCNVCDKDKNDILMVTNVHCRKCEYEQYLCKAILNVIIANHFNLSVHDLKSISSMKKEIKSSKNDYYKLHLEIVKEYINDDKIQYANNISKFIIDNYFQYIL